MSPVDFKNAPCRSVEFKKWQCRPVDFRGLDPYKDKEIKKKKSNKDTVMMNELSNLSLLYCVNVTLLFVLSSYR